MSQQTKGDIMKLFLVLFLFSTSLFASTAKFNMDFHVKSLSTDEVVAKFNCLVNQTLTWENQSNFFKCENDEGQIVTVMNVGVTVGINHDSNTAYTIFRNTGKRGLLTGLFEKSGIELKLISGAGVKIYYLDRAPISSGTEFMLEGDVDGYVMVIDNMNYVE